VPIGAENIAELKHVEMCALYYWRDSTTVTRRKVIEYFETWKPRRMYIDENGVGGGVFDAIKDDMYKQNIQGVSNVVGLNLRGTQRTDIYMRVSDLIDDEKVLFINDENLIEHFKSYSTIRDRYGKATVSKTANRHDDISDACVFALDGIIRELGYNKLSIGYMDDIDFENMIDQSTPTFNQSDIIW